MTPTVKALTRVMRLTAARLGEQATRALNRVDQSPDEDAAALARLATVLASAAIQLERGAREAEQK